MLIQLIDPDPGPGSDERHARIVPALSSVGVDQLVRAGQVIDVPAEIAGAGPHWRAPRDGDDLQFMETRLSEDGQTRSVHDLGHGLLAQTDVWAKVEKPAAKSEGGDK